jgi:hypothetical protein
MGLFVKFNLIAQILTFNMNGFAGDRVISKYFIFVPRKKV